MIMINFGLVFLIIKPSANGLLSIKYLNSIFETVETHIFNHTNINQITIGRGKDCSIQFDDINIDEC